MVLPSYRPFQSACFLDFLHIMFNGMRDLDINPNCRLIYWENIWVRLDGLGSSYPSKPSLSDRLGGTRTKHHCKCFTTHLSLKRSTLFGGSQLAKCLLNTFLSSAYYPLHCHRPIVYQQIPEFLPCSFGLRCFKGLFACFLQRRGYIWVLLHFCLGVWRW